MSFSRLISTESYRRGAVLSVLFNIVSKGILFLLTIIIARYFGSNIKTDIYFFVFTTMLLFSSFVNAIDTAVLIPESMRIREKKGHDQATVFLNYFLLIYLFIGVAFTAGMYFFGTKVFGLISRFRQEDILHYRDYFWIGSFFFIFHVLTNYLNSILTSLKYFSLPMVLSSIKSGIVIVCILLLRSGYDVLSVFWAGLISYAVNLLLQLYVLKKNAGWRFIFGKVELAKDLRRRTVFAELGQVATVASSMFPLYLLSGYGSGIISVMNYGKNIADIPNTLITAQFANVSGIQLNEQAARNDHAGMNDSFLRTSKMMVFILVPLGFLLFILAKPLVELFYQSRNFSPDSVEETAMFLKLLSVTIFSIGINAMVTRLFIAVQAIRQAFYYQLFFNLLLIGVMALSTNYAGAYSYPYAIIMVNLLNFFAMYLVCRRLVPYIDYAALLRYTLLMILINAVIAASIYFAMQVFNLDGIIALIAGSSIYLFILLLLNRKFKLNTELAQLFKDAA
jgi:putative peptidoglycan lipid II flippase